MISSLFLMILKTNSFNSWIWQKNQASFSDAEKIDKNKIYGCTSQAWVVANPNEDETYTFRSDSDALIVKGLLTLLEKIFSNQPVTEILSINSNDV